MGRKSNAKKQRRAQGVRDELRRAIHNNNVQMMTDGIYSVPVEEQLRQYAKSVNFTLAGGLHDSVPVDAPSTEPVARVDDIHTRMAAEHFGVPAEAVTIEQRWYAKNVLNFGQLYANPVDMPRMTLSGRMKSAWPAVYAGTAVAVTNIREDSWLNAHDARVILVPDHIITEQEADQLIEAFKEQQAADRFISELKLTVDVPEDDVPTDEVVKPLTDEQVARIEHLLTRVWSAIANDLEVGVLYAMSKKGALEVVLDCQRLEEELDNSAQDVITESDRAIVKRFRDLPFEEQQAIGLKLNWW